MFFYILLTIRWVLLDCELFIQNFGMEWSVFVYDWECVVFLPTSEFTNTFVVTVHYSKKLSIMLNWIELHTPFAQRACNFLTTFCFVVSIFRLFVWNWKFISLNSKIIMLCYLSRQHSRCYYYCCCWNLFGWLTFFFASSKELQVEVLSGCDGWGKEPQNHANFWKTEINSSVLIGKCVRRLNKKKCWRLTRLNYCSGNVLCAATQNRMLAMNEMGQA